MKRTATIIMVSILLIIGMSLATFVYVDVALTEAVVTHPDADTTHTEDNAAHTDVNEAHTEKQTAHAESEAAH
jgi:hypothetical protein